MIRLAINGYGRIGRCILRALYEQGFNNQSIRIVAINEPADIATIAHLTKYDSTHGRFNAKVAHTEKTLSINDDIIAISHEHDIQQLNWRDLHIDYVLECSGRYHHIDELQTHIRNGAQHVLLSQPGEANIKTIVYGLNHPTINSNDNLLSAASCTSNAAAPVISVLDEAFGVENGILTTIHSLMNDQPVLDAYHNTDLRKTRAASDSVIPVNTGLAAGIDRLLPHLCGRFSARALRVPVTNVSAIDLCVQLKNTQSAENVNNALRAAAGHALIGTLAICDEPLASCDYIHDTRSAIVDIAQTRCNGKLANMLIWFDNEWGFANRMLDIISYWADIHNGG